MNPYTVHHPRKHHRTHLTTASSWDEIPFDNQLMVWRNVFEQMRAERYRARVLRFKLKGFIGEAEWRELWQGIEDWLDLEHRAQRQTQARLEQQAIERRLETRLREVLTALFRCDTADKTNVTGEAWAQIAFHIQAVLSPGGGELPEIRATSADGLHRIRLLLSSLPEGGPYVGINIMYYGPHRFRTGGVLDRVRGANMNRGGTMQEFVHGGEPLQVRGLDDPRVWDHWQVARERVAHERVARERVARERVAHDGARR
jgi:hypothetical protein